MFPFWAETRQGRVVAMVKKMRQPPPGLWRVASAKSPPGLDGNSLFPALAHVDLSLEVIMMIVFGGGLWWGESQCGQGSYWLAVASSPPLHSPSNKTPPHPTSHVIPRLLSALGRYSGSTVILVARLEFIQFPPPLVCLRVYRYIGLHQCYPDIDTLEPPTRKSFYHI
ncbi:hypothetical protein AAG570_010080 [Ranatra chinensis]|uniref:Uncharacterized protein n=1 Tax=Ranatra chinensis TaxID=642074 RepID=A0ABD0YLM0_9HEMI